MAAGIKAPQQKNLRIKGLNGSLDAVVVAASYKLHPQDYLIVVQDQEEGVPVD